MEANGLGFELRRPILLLYSVLGLALSAALLFLALERGVDELSRWSIAYLGLGLLSWRIPDASPVAAGFMALLLGFVRTYRSGYNLDLGLGLIALSVGLYVLARARRDGRATLDVAGICLFAVAAWSLISLAFSIVRIRSFVPAPGFSYHAYQFNASGFASDEAVVRAIIGATATFAWFGLYEYARSVRLRRQELNVAVFVALLVNTAALLVQRYVDPGFLHPAALGETGRLNGVTSFCYALGDVVLALYLLLPAWGVTRGRLGLFTAASVGLLTYAAVASGSRTALFTMLVASILWMCLRAGRLGRARRPRAAFMALAVAVLLVSVTAVGYWLTPATQESPLGRLKDGIKRQGLFGHLVEQRLATYPLLVRVMRAYPLSGVGVGLYPAEASKQHALLALTLKVHESYLLTSFAPNQFLNTGVELGIPAMLALVVVFVSAGAALVRRPRERAGDFAVSLLALVAALQLGPEFYNSEALVFFWLIIGFAARGDSEDGVVGTNPAGSRTLSSAVAAGLLAAAVAVGVAGHLLSLKSLAVDQQWRRLRWRLGMGMLPMEPGGRWSQPEATFSVDTNAPAVTVRWHAGDEAAPGYHARVSFYVDGVLVEASPARAGVIRESVLPLPAAAGFKRISVRVSPPFVPAAASGGEDRRNLGIFVHSVIPEETSAGTRSP